MVSGSYLHSICLCRHELHFGRSPSHCYVSAQERPEEESAPRCKRVILRSKAKDGEGAPYPVLFLPAGGASQFRPAAFPRRRVSRHVDENDMEIRGAMLGASESQHATS